jgi:hypothetical protein
MISNYRQLNGFKCWQYYGVSIPCGTYFFPTFRRKLLFLSYSNRVWLTKRKTLKRYTNNVQTRTLSLLVLKLWWWGGQRKPFFFFQNNSRFIHPAPLINKAIQAIYIPWHLGLPQMDRFSSNYSNQTILYYRIWLYGDSSSCESTEGHSCSQIPPTFHVIQMFIAVFTRSHH